MVLLVLQLLVVFCNQLETAAQNESSSVIIPSAVEIVTVSLIPSVSETTTNMTINDITNQTASITVPIVLTIATSPDINPVTSMDVFTLTDMISSSDIMVTSQLSVDTTMSSFIITITTAEISPVHTIDTSTMAVMTTVVMASSSVMPMTTAVVITTSNPVPVPEVRNVTLIVTHYMYILMDCRVIVVVLAQE